MDDDAVHKRPEIGDHGSAVVLCASVRPAIVWASALTVLTSRSRAAGCSAMGTGVSSGAASSASTRNRSSFSSAILCLASSSEIAY